MSGQSRQRSRRQFRLLCVSLREKGKVAKEIHYAAVRFFQSDSTPTPKSKHSSKPKAFLSHLEYNQIGSAKSGAGCSGKGDGSIDVGTEAVGNSPRELEAADVGMKEGPKEGSRLAGLKEHKSQDVGIKDADKKYSKNVISRILSPSILPSR